MQMNTVASEAYHDWSGEAAGAHLRVNFTLKLLLSQNFCNRPLMRFISFASNIGPAAAVPAGPAPAPLDETTYNQKLDGGKAWERGYGEGAYMLRGGVVLHICPLPHSPQSLN